MNSICLFERLLRRSLIANVYPESQIYRDKLKAMLKKPVSVYAGFDATSDSLHVGNLAVIMNLLHFQCQGHQVICLIGDATTQIGDPSGHAKDRLKLGKNLIDKNSLSIEKTLRRIFSNYRESEKRQLREPIFVRNSEWYKDLNIVDFVGDVFREVRVGSLLHKKSISERLKSSEGLSLSEFCYQVFQAYDWMQLRQKFDCRLQIGGADQGGNIYSGHDLIKKYMGETDSIGLLSPLITNSDGKKLGKSTEKSDNGIWLNPEKTSPYKFYQFFHRTPDNLVEQYLKIFSLYDDSTIEELLFNNLKDRDVWLRQKKLASSVCKLIHGEKGLISAKKITHAFHNQDPMKIADLDDDELEQLFDSNSIIKIMHRDELRVIDLIRKINLFSNDSEAVQKVTDGHVFLNGARVTSINIPITTDLIVGSGITLMKVGKRLYYLFKWIR